MKKIRILVVDGESVVRDGIVAILSFQSDMQVVGEATDGIEAVELADKLHPDVITLGLALPRQDGLTTIPILMQRSPNSRILVLTSFAESERVYQSIKAGALGYLLKDARRNQFLQAIRDVANGQASIQPTIAKMVINEIENPADLMYTADPLTPRELETLRLIAHGLSTEEIATTMVVHERTIAKYVSSILEKLHLANRTQAALYAISVGLSESRLAGDTTTDAPPPPKKKKWFGK